jgi:hypothetical protein
LTFGYDDLLRLSPAVPSQPLLLPALYVYGRLTTTASSRPVPVEAQRAYLKTLVRQLHLFAALDELLERAASHAIAVIPLKGAVLAPQLYSDPAARPMADLDLLVSPRDMDAMASALRGLGYSETTAHRPRWRPSYHHHAIFCRASGGGPAVVMEIHYRLVHELGAKIDTEGLVARAHPATLRGRPVLALRTEDHLYFVLLHAATHAFLDNPLWVLDSRLLVEELGLGLDYARDTTTQLACSYGTEVAIATAWRLYETSWGGSSKLTAPSGKWTPRRERLLRWLGCPEDPIEVVPAQHADGWRHRLRSRAVRLGLTDSAATAAATVTAKIGLRARELRE